MHIAFLSVCERDINIFEKNIFIQNRTHLNFGNAHQHGCSKLFEERSHIFFDLQTSSADLVQSQILHLRRSHFDTAIERLAFLVTEKILAPHSCNFIYESFYYIF